MNAIISAANTAPLSQRAVKNVSVEALVAEVLVPPASVDLHVVNMSVNRARRRAR